MCSLTNSQHPNSVSMSSDKAAPSESVRVVVRCRPLNSTETQNGNTRVVEMDARLGSITVKDTSSSDGSAKTFSYDAVFDWTSTQELVFNDTASPIVDSVLDGYNGTVFAYGQTGTGKTHTMEGSIEGEQRGLIPRAFEQVFNRITGSAGKQFLVRATFLEIYQDAIRDLIGETDNLELKENTDSGVYVKDLTSHVVHNVPDVMKLLAHGQGNRKKGATLMNQNSSRSHCIFTLTIECSEKGPDGEQHIRAGKLNMVDLAGSERQDKTGAQGVRLKEAAKINLSLSALGNVISALTSKVATHIPYRDSKLTRLLQDSLGGNTKTVMVANVGPADYNFEETISTLRFASRAKRIQNKPTVNEDPKDTLLREYQLEIQRLREQLMEMPEGGTASEPNSRGNSRPASGKPQKVVVEKVVERVVTKHDIDESKVREIEESSLRAKKALEEKLTSEKESMQAQTKETEQKTQQMAKQLKKHESKIERERREREGLMAKLQEVEANLLVGHQLMDEAKKQEAALAQKRELLEQKKTEKVRMERELHAREMQQLSLVEKYESLEKTIADRTEKLKKLHSKYDEIESDLNDVQAEFQREREDMLENIRELQRHLQLKSMVIDLFVPHSDRARIEARAHWDEERTEWVLAPVDFTPLLYMKRPMSAPFRSGCATAQFARVASVVHENSTRYRQENIASLDLDMPERTTQDFQDQAAR